MEDMACKAGISIHRAFVSMGTTLTVARRRRRQSVTSSAATPSLRAKVVLVGAPGVGKTTLFYRLVDQTLPESVPSTTSANIGAKLIHIEGQAPVLVELWDVPYRVYTGGRIFETYLKGTDAVLLVYDVSVEDSWQSALSYYKILTEHLKNTQIQGAPPTVFATIGNKIDLHSSSTDTVTNPNQPPPSQQLTDIASFQVSALEQRHTLSILRTIAQSIATSRPS